MQSRLSWENLGLSFLDAPFSILNDLGFAKKLGFPKWQLPLRGLEWCLGLLRPPRGDPNPKISKDATFNGLVLLGNFTGKPHI